jgi:ankyrin repeat protein
MNSTGSIEKYALLASKYDSKNKKQSKTKKDDSSISLEESDIRDPRKYLLANSKTPSLNRLSNSTAITPAKLVRIMNQRQQYVMKSKEEQQRDKMTELFETKRKQMLSSRLRALPMSAANQFAATGNEYCLMKEIELGHDPNSRDAYNGRTILHEAVANGQFSIVSFLLSSYNNIDCNAVTKLGSSTALHLAVEGNHRAIASVLLGNGADFHQQDKQGNTPFHLVSSLPVIKLLCKYPIDPTVRNKKNLTPLESYLERVSPDQHEREIIELMRFNEENKFLENTRLQVMMEQLKLEKETMKANRIRSENSSTIGGRSSSLGISQSKSMNSILKLSNNTKRTNSPNKTEMKR